MKDSAESENHNTGGKGAPSPAHQRREDMSPHEMVHGLIPRAPIGAHAGAVPPLRVELAVAEVHHFRERVEEGLEQGEETCKPDYERYRGELHDSLDDGG